MARQGPPVVPSLLLRTPQEANRRADASPARRRGWWWRRRWRSGRRRLRFHPLLRGWGMGGGWPVMPVPRPFSPCPHPVSNLVQLLLLFGRQVLLHFGDRLIEKGFCFIPVFPVKGLEFLSGAAGNAIDLFPLLCRQLEFPGKTPEEQVSDGGAFSGKDARNLVSDVHPGSHASDEYARKEENNEPCPYFPFLHDESLFRYIPRASVASSPEGSWVRTARRSWSMVGTAVSR